MAKSSVIIPLPESPAAANTTGTPSGIVSLIRNFCCGADPTKYLFISRLSSKSEIGFFTLLSWVCKNLLMSNSSSIASAASHFSGFDEGMCSVTVDFAPAAFACASTMRASFLPASSLSGQRITSLFLKGEKSNFEAVFSDSIPAPPIVHVAAYPSSVSASAHFSPSTQITLSAARTSGMLYRGLGSGKPWRPFINWRNCFLGFPALSRTISPVSSLSKYLRTVTITSPCSSV